MVKSNKILVIAGTHQREIGFSHPVANLLLDYYNLDQTRPTEVLIGEDNATKSLIWDTPDLVIAKLYTHGSGKPSAEWMNKQSLEKLAYISKFNLANNRQKRPPRIAERFNKDDQWTSVHDPIIQKYNPLFFIDLHSYHILTAGQDGRGMQINTCADRQLDCIVINALKNAQMNAPSIYGQEPPKIRSTQRIRSELFPEYFTKEELLALSQNSKTGIIQRFIFNKKLKSVYAKAEKIQEEEVSAANENGWFFVSYGRPDPRGDHYCFEAKHWQKNQQEATAKFIMQYLIPEVKNFGVKHD